MKKFLLAGSLLMLAGCSNSLDTSQLTESKESEDGFIKFYSAPSVDVAIDALPYEVNLPEKLPFKTVGFKSLGITDIGGKGQNPDAQFMASDKQDNNLLLSTTTGNIDYPDSNPEEITLNNGYQAQYSLPNQLDVIVKDVTYSYTLNMSELNENELKDELLKLAEQLAE